MRGNLPNQITVGRLLLAAVFFGLLAQYSQRDPSLPLLNAAIVVFIVAAVSDFFDGYLARRYNLVTPLGRILDPVADKVLVCGAFTFLAGANFVDADGRNVTGVAPWMVVLIVAREMLVTAIRAYNESVGVDFGAAVYGKIKMWAQSIAAPVLLFLVGYGDRLLSAWQVQAATALVVYTTVTVTVLSMVYYLVRSKHILWPEART